MKAQMAALITAQRATAARQIEEKHEPVLAAARTIARQLATLIEDLENQRIPSEVPDCNDLEHMKSDLDDFRAIAIRIGLLDDPSEDQYHLGEVDNR